MVYVGLNGRFRFYRSDPGHFFGKHTDGSFQRNEAEMSKVTLTINLNREFTGGDTALSSERLEGEQWTKLATTG